MELLYISVRNKVNPLGLHSLRRLDCIKISIGSCSQQQNKWYEEPILLRLGASCALSRRAFVRAAMGHTPTLDRRKVHYPRLMSAVLRRQPQAAPPDLRQLMEAWPQRFHRCCH
ncbi:hypothetical protein F7725_009213 [Dissostichus mawsoni]|uniref:Uncharacterized protein n=1 Tax=Dissostichus mawsoni TaxID=36200 RepID=A0A7J5Z6E2_DISMA|nr:hypothetical protein F7725_009213 [Dissostichus mawsoni]